MSLTAEKLSSWNACFGAMTPGNRELVVVVIGDRILHTVLNSFNIGILMLLFFFFSVDVLKM